jgi:hypothetical protein
LEGFVRCPRDQRELTAHDLDRNPGNLIGRRSKAEDDFRKALPEGAMVIDFRKTEVLERARAHGRKQLAFGIVGGQFSSRNTLEERFQPRGIHRRMIMLLNDAR